MEGLDDDDDALTPPALSADAVDAVAATGRHAPTPGSAHGRRPASAVVCAKFNGGITERLLDGALAGPRGRAGSSPTR